ncbi:MAG: hypothetical protein ACK2VD_03025 [Anaerolineae bacterium]
MRMRRILSGVLALGLLLSLVTGSTLLPVKASDPARPRTSFDADTYADLAIGVPYEDIGTVADAGAVNVLYGTSPAGLSATGDQIWYQGSAGVVDLAETGDVFATALAVGDLNGDGYADLAIGVPYEEVGTATNAGAVHILYGASDGLTAIGNQLWTQDSAGIEGAAEDSDWFGSALAVGDFDGDGYADLAIGVPAEDVVTLDSAGAVNVIYGSANGLTASGDQIWTQDTTGIQGTAEALDQFGYSLAAGDLDGDGYADLAIGVPSEGVGSVVRAGAVNVIYGSAGGLTDIGNLWIHQDTTGILDICETDDVFGWALTISDFSGDGYADLAIGAPGEDYGGKADVGAVNVVYGSVNGLTDMGDQFWHQDISGTQGGAEDGDRFGRVLTSGDFDGDGRGDLAVGIPYEDNGSTVDTGAVHVFYGTDGGLSVVGNWWFLQNTAGMLDTAEEYDYFGRALAAGDLNGDGYADLAVGVPYEDVGTIGDAGAVSVVYGSAGGLTTTGNQFWHQDRDYVEGACETGDRFGFAVATLPLQRHKVYLPSVLVDH